MTRRRWPPHDGPERRGWFGAALTATFGPIYYWLGLYDPATRRPSHTRVTSTVGFAVGIAAVPFIVRMDMAEDGSMGTGVIVYVSLILAASFGQKMFGRWIDSKAASRGLPAVSAEVVGVAQAQAAEIAARRAQGDGTFVASP